MALLTAKALRESLDLRILIPLPNGAGDIECRKPDLQDALFRNLIPMPMLTTLLRDLFTAAGAGEAPEVGKHLLEHADPNTIEFVDRWACLAIVAPLRAVMTQEELTADTILVTVFPLDTRIRILTETFEYSTVHMDPRRPVAGAEFRTERGGATPGPDRTPVRDAALGADRRDEPAGGAGL